MDQRKEQKYEISRARDKHWSRRDWPTRSTISIGTSNIINEPLVSRENVVLSPLHIKLGLMKQHVKALQKDEDCFKYMCRKFPGLSNEKLKQGVFDGPQIRQLIKDLEIVNSMTEPESIA